MNNDWPGGLPPVVYICPKCEHKTRKGSRVENHAPACPNLKPRVIW